MASKTGCPGPDTLQALIDGSLNVQQQSELTEHIDSCECCQHKLDAIACGEGDWCASACRGIDMSRPENDSAYWPALQNVRAEATAQVATPPDPNETSDGRTHARLADADLSFLSPPDKHEFIGRLGRYNVVGVIGRGGMGLVLRALDVCLRRQVAVKVLDPSYAKNEQARERFFREAQTAAAVQHENVVAIHTVEKRDEDKLPYLVMQLVGGESLQDRLDRGEPMTVHEILNVGRQTALGLAAAHERGLIHRDIKPGNVLLEAGSDRVRLTDFGLARCAEDVRLTATGFAAGTPLYMSPEQARGETLDVRSDLFSLGSVLYAMAAGRPPFEGSSPFVVLQQVTERPHRPVREVNPAIPEGLATVMDRLLAKKPEDRIQTAAEVAERLADEQAKLADPAAKPASPWPSRLLWAGIGFVVGVAAAAASLRYQ